MRNHATPPGPGTDLWRALRQDWLGAGAEARPAEAAQEGLLEAAIYSGFAAAGTSSTFSIRSR